MLIKQKCIQFFKILFPANLAEWGIFIFFLLAYGFLGTYIALNYRIVFDSRIPWDAYFSFDNKAIVMTGGSFERHPLSYYFFNWMREFIFLFTNGKTDANFRFFLVLFSNITVSLSLVHVYKYLRNIIKIPLKISLLIIFFYSLFATNILLSFTPETYTYTLFFLVLFNYYSAIALRSKEKISGLALVFAGVTVGGLTVTNFTKVFVPVLFEKNIFKNWRKLGNAAFRVILSIGVFVLLYLNRINFKYENILSKSGAQYEKFSNAKSAPVWDMIVSYFFGGNILFPSFFIREKHNMKGFYFEAIFMDTFSSVLSYTFIFALILMLLWSYIKNFKNRFVQILMLGFLVDFLIHCIGKFGLHTAYIYGGHFVFIFPLMLGWLFYTYRFSPKFLSAFMSILSVFTVYLIINNYHRMIEFFDFLNRYYQ
ncbi:DUF6080 domain-containing protein [Chryseobacterium sp. Leaf180]|uniref:DUF6080 domain-containing protein n=1 Tax=Chryseobacterium sp. Leaf180 TaxID=1736289 RepID=UPI0009EC6B50|nr:DUF6080 domain-containing protein [Chryseobacterium sp. Leaf180]